MYKKFFIIAALLVVYNYGMTLSPEEQNFLDLVRKCTQIREVSHSFLFDNGEVHRGISLLNDASRQDLVALKKLLKKKINFLALIPSGEYGQISYNNFVLLNQEDKHSRTLEFLFYVAALATSSSIVYLWNTDEHDTSSLIPLILTSAVMIIFNNLSDNSDTKYYLRSCIQKLLMTSEE